MVKRTGKRRWTVAVLAAGACAALAILFIFVIFPGQRLARAGKLYEAGVLRKRSWRLRFLLRAWRSNRG